MKRLMWIALLIALLITGRASAASDTYDHIEYGFDLDGAHREVACESCHVRGVFAGTPRECGFCHDGTGIYAESARSLTHPLTTENCESCHIVADWVAIKLVDHAEVLGACSSCHNGRLGEGLPPGHVQTNQECDICHTDVTWNAVMFDHGSITSGCISCHDGRQATGKSATHVLTTEICEDCHTVDFWEPVFRMDHAQVLGSCESCHDGQQATGKHPLHVVSNNQCDDCHTTNAWQPAVFDHSAVVPGSCAGCHDGQQATGMDAQHFVTSASCDTCHSTIAWIPATFDHDDVTPGTCAGCHDGQTATGMDTGHFQTPQSCDNCHTTSFWVPDTFVHTSPTYPGDHAGNLQCTDCHQTNAEQVTWTAPAYQPDCAGCHANDYRDGPHKKHENPDVKYTVSELRDCTGACHVYTDSSLTTIKDFRPGPEHSVNQGGF